MGTRTMKLGTYEELDLKAEENDTVFSIKEKVETKWKIPMPQQRLVFKGKTLEDSKQLKEYQIDDGCKLFVSVKKDSNPPSAPAHVQAPPAQVSSGTISSALSSAAQMLHGFVGAAESSRKEDFWDQLYAVLAKHFRKEDAIKILQRYRMDYKESLSRLSLDQLERLAIMGLQRENAKS